MPIHVVRVSVQKRSPNVFIFAQVTGRLQLVGQPENTSKGKGFSNLDTTPSQMKTVVSEVVFPTATKPSVPECQLFNVVVRFGLSLDPLHQQHKHSPLVAITPQPHRVRQRVTHHAPARVWGWNPSTIMVAHRCFSENTTIDIYM